MPKLPCRHAQLTSVMPLVRSKVAQEVLHIRREILPSGSRHPATVGYPEADELDHPIATSRQGLDEIGATDTTQIHESGHSNAMCCTQALDPPAAAVVQVGCHHPNREPGNVRNLTRPNGSRQMCHQKLRGTVVGSPRGD
jgi:hypothetical protein